MKLLARHDLVFDICVLHHQLANVIKLVRQCPEVRFVLDHIGKPAIKAGQMDPWRQQMKELAALPERRLQDLGRRHRGRPQELDARAAPPLHRPRHRCLRLRPQPLWRRLARPRARRHLSRLGRHRRLGHRRRERRTSGGSSSATTPSGSIGSTDARRGAEAKSLFDRRGPRARPRPPAEAGLRFHRRRRRGRDARSAGTRRRSTRSSSCRTR